MPFEFTKRGAATRFNAVKNPLHFTGVRKDFLVHTIEDNGGLIRVKVTGDITAQVVAGHSIYLVSDNGLYSLPCTVVSRSYSAPDTTINFSQAYLGSASTGYINLTTARASYRVSVQIVDFGLNVLIDSLEFSPYKDGNTTMDLSIVKNLLSYDHSASFDTGISTEPTVGFSLLYTERWVNSGNAPQYDTPHKTFAVLARMPIGSSSGLSEYLITHPNDAMKTTILLSSSQILSANTSPPTVIAAPGAGKIIIPISYTVSIDYNSAAYATNTDFRFEVNGQDVSGTITGVLNTSVDRVATQYPEDNNITTSMVNQPLVFKVLTGNPTAGNSSVVVSVIYQVHDFTFAP